MYNIGLYPKASKGETARMAKRKSDKHLKNTEALIDHFDQARDELFSHILRCGVLEAAAEHQKEWFDDTMDYLAGRFERLTDEELSKLRELGERFCRPVIRNPETLAATR
jgi:hypothetical protein